MSLPLIDKAFLPEYLDQLLIFEIAATGIPLILQVYIFVSVCWKVRDTEFKIRRELIYLFFLCVVSAVLYTTTVTIYNVFKLMSYTSHPAYPVIYSIGNFLYGLFMLMLLLTLIARLYVAFQGSALKMTKMTVYVFTLIIVLAFVLMILAVSEYTSFQTSSSYSTLFLCSLLLGVCVYIVGCALAVRILVVNLSTVAKMQTCSHRDVSPKAEDISLNEKQQKLLHLSAKYILLFFVAIFSTTFILFLSFIVSHELRGLFGAIDFCVNLLCMYLQFAFAAEQYQKCCGYLDSRCREMEMKRLKRDIHKQHSLSLPEQLATMMK